MIQSCNSDISCMFVNVEMRTRGYVSFDVTLDGAAIYVLDDHYFHP